MSDEGRRARAQLSADDPGGSRLSADDPSGIGTTIVGGQPPGAPRRPLRAIPVGIEKLLFAAAIEPAFREALLRDREAAISARGLALAPSELAMLKLAPASQLAAAIDALDTSATNLARRGFLCAVAGAVTLAAGSVLSGCDEPQTQAGIRRQEASAGIRDTGLLREGPMAGIDPGYPPRDVAGMTDRPWRDAGPPDTAPRDAGPSDAKRTEK